LWDLWRLCPVRPWVRTALVNDRPSVRVAMTQSQGGIARSILVRFASPSPTTTEQYDETVSRLQEGGDFPPEGMDYHCCFVSDGSIRVSEVWDSREQFEAFGQRLMPLLEEVGVDPGQPEIFEIYNVVRR
jgi:hypothetical protein